MVEISGEAVAASLQQLAFMALRFWGKEAEDIRLIKMRENAVFQVVDSRGSVFAMRVHRDGYHSGDALRSELQWISALRDWGMDVPTVVPANDGSLLVTASLPGVVSPRRIDLFEWIDGRPLGTSERGLDEDLRDVERTYRTVGELMARLHNHAGEWVRPSGFQRRSWDLHGLVGEQPLWGRFWELGALKPAERDLLVRARDRVRRELGALAANADRHGRFGLIHADFVPENLLLTADGQVKLIDFDDAGFGWHMFDLATALYFIQEDPNFESAKAGMIAGYREHRDLSDELLEQLPVFMAARGFTYLGWAHTRPLTEEGLAILPHVTRLACIQSERLLSGGRLRRAQ
jgi:Ser/Thr protein kinase RdoA (MazF antagonist)